MNTPFKPGSGATWLSASNIETGRKARAHSPREQTAMLVLIVTVALVGSFVIEYLLHLFASNYEIEWRAPAKPERDTAHEIVRVMRETHRESERQMNKPFKVASADRW
jgi:hypothetical protein